MTRLPFKRRNLLKTTGVLGLLGPLGLAGDAKAADSLTEERIDITGFHRPQTSGLLYGHTGESTPEGRVGEWADAHTEAVTLVPSTDVDRLEASLFVKQVGPEFHVGLHLPSDVEDEELRGLRIQIDRDGTGELSQGDVRMVWGPQRLEGADGERGVHLDVYQDGRFVEVDTDLRVAMVEWSRPIDGGLGVEAKVNVDDIDRLLDEDPEEDGERNFTVDLILDEIVYGLETDPEPIQDSYPFKTKYRSLDPIELPFDSSGVQRLEITQSVQDTDNSLTLVQNKETLGRVFVEHEADEPIEVDVTLSAAASFGPITIGLGELSRSFTVPPTEDIDREELDHSANFELPAHWRTWSTVEFEATVSRSGFISLPWTDQKASVTVDFEETYDPTIWVGRVGTTDVDGLPPEESRNVVMNAFEEIMPVANADTKKYVTDAIQDFEGDDYELLEQLNADGLTIRALGRTVDQVYGVTQDRSERTGLSTPSWGSTGPDTHLASYGDDVAYRPESSYPTLIAHEIVHNIGGYDWAMHCGYDDDKDSGCNSGEVGWSPTYDIVPTDTTELMRSGGFFQEPDPGKWVSPYRWEKLVDRFQDFTPNDPVPDDFDSSSLSAGLETGETFRIVKGRLYRGDDTEEAPIADGELDPSLELPGYAPPPEPEDVEDPHAILEITYEDDVVELPFRKSFEPLECEVDLDREKDDRSGFAFSVPDNGSIQAISLVDPRTRETWDDYSSRRLDIDDVEIETPEEFDRHEESEIRVAVDADTEPLYVQLLYDAGDGYVLPFSSEIQLDRDGEATLSVRFSDNPGGLNARFLVYVSDGLVTQGFESERFAVEPLEPEVRIDRADRWAVETDEDADRGEVVNRTRPVETVAGAPMALRATVRDEFGDPLPDEAVRWTIRDRETGDELEVRAEPSGDVFTHRFDRPGRFTVTVAAIDPRTELEATDRIDVVVSDPPLPHEETLEQFEGPDRDVSVYADVDGVIQTDGLIEAFADWQAAEIDAELLLEVFDAWQSGDEVA